MNTTTFGRPGHESPMALAYGALVQLSRWAGRALSSGHKAQKTQKTGQRPGAVATSRTAEAAEVREMAYRLQHSQPGFAHDLAAAADRHEHGSQAFR